MTRLLDRVLAMLLVAHAMRSDKTVAAWLVMLGSWFLSLCAAGVKARGLQPESPAAARLLAGCASALLL